MLVIEKINIPQQYKIAISEITFNWLERQGKKKKKNIFINRAEQATKVILISRQKMSFASPLLA